MIIFLIPLPFPSSLPLPLPSPHTHTHTSHTRPRRSSPYSKVRVGKPLLYLVFLHLLQASLHVVQVGLGFLLMLVAMTFNGWLFLAVCFGAGLGYLLFAKFRNINSFKKQSDPCHWAWPSSLCVSVHDALCVQLSSQCPLPSETYPISSYCVNLYHVIVTRHALCVDSLGPDRRYSLNETTAISINDSTLPSICYIYSGLHG